MNLQIREFEQNIINYVNQVNLPIEVKRLAIKDVFYQVDKMAEDAINLEIQRIKQEQLNKEQQIEAQNNEEEATE